MKYLYTVTLFFLIFFSSRPSSAQETRLDELFAGADTTRVIDSLMKDFDAFLDSVTQPKSFFNISAAVGTGFFSFKNMDSYDFNFEKKAIFSPSVSYYHKSGLGLSLTGYLMRENDKFNSYQYAVSPSYDYVRNKNFSAGVAYTRYYTKENLSFYTTPIQNELYGYFNYKKWWLEPGIAFSYGWGSNTEYEEREIEVLMRRLQNSKKNVIVIRHNESVKDFSTLISVRHNFEWFRLFGRKRDMLTFTPVFLVSGGTQNFGFNTSFSSNSKVISNVLPSNRNITDVIGYDMQSATLVLRLDYAVGKFYIQPQTLFDYYLHQSDKRLNNVFSITAGVNL